MTSRAARPRLLAAALAASALACGDAAGPGAPAPLGISPAAGLEGQPVAVVVTGTGFEPIVETDYGAGGTVDTRFTVRLGATALRGVRLEADGSLSATVPETLPPGTYDLAVADPAGREGVLPAAYRVLPATSLDAAVVGFRIDPIGPQQAMRPFAVTVTAVDAGGAAVAGFTGPVALTDSTGTAVPASAGLFVAGRWSGLVEVRAPSPADVLRAEDAAGRSGASAPFGVAPVPAARLRFTTAPRDLEAGACSEAIGLALEDGYGFPTEAAAPLAVTLVPSAADVVLFEDAACAVPLLAPGFAAGEGALVVHARATVAGAGTISAAVAALPGDAQALSVRAGPPAELAFVTSPRAATAGTCSAPVVVELRDAYGNPAARSADVALGAPLGGLALFSDAACAVVAAAVPLGADARATFHFSGLVAGPGRVTAAALGLSAAQDATVVAEGLASQLAFVTAPRTTPAGGCSEALAVEAQDSFGNPVPSPGVAVAFASSADRTFHADPACADPPLGSVTLAAGASQAVVHVRGTVAQAAPVGASAAGLTAAAQVATVVAGPPAGLAFVTPPRTLAAGSCSAELTVRLLDAWGNAAAAPGLALSLASAPAGALALHADAACSGAITSIAVGAGASEATFHVTGTAAGAAEVSISGPGVGAAAQTETVLPATRDRLVLVGGGGQAVVAGECSAAVTLEARDAYGNPSGAGIARTVDLAAPGAPPDLALHDGGGCAGAAVASLALPQGATRVTLSFRGGRAASFAIRAAVAGWAPVDAPAAVVPAARDRLVLLSGGAQQPAAGTCSAPVTLQSQDAYGNPSGVGAPATVALSAPGAAADLVLYAGAGCAPPPAAALPLATGQPEAVFSFRGTSAGPFAVEAAVPGWAPLAVAEAVAPGPPAALAWSAVPSPQYQAVPFPVTLVARDAFGNDTPSFAGAATFTSAAAVTLECASGCGGAATTLPFTGGVWSGALDVRPGASAVQVVATAGALSGTSLPFDVIGAGARAPPEARLTASPPVVTTGQTVLLDASGSVDYQTLDRDLVASWDFGGAAGGAGGDTAQGWTAWAPGLSAAHAWACGGPASCTFTPRVAIRDGDGDVGYATVRVLVLPSGADLCVVTTPVDVDDGATSCGGYRGADGALSLAEAVRLSNTTNGRQVITFSGPMTVSGTGTLQIAADVDLLAPPGVVLDGKGLSVVNTPAILITGLEIRGQAAPMVFPNRTRLTLEDVRVHDMAGIQALGTATLRRVHVSGCAADCVRADDPSGVDTLTVEASEFEDGETGIFVNRCARGKLALDVSSTTFAGLGTAVDVRCAGDARIRHVTFHQNGTALALADGGGHVVQNAVFTGHTGPVATCGAAVAFAAREYHLLFGNAPAPSCLSAADPGALEGLDPLYVFEARRDLRLQLASPARNTPLDVTGAGLDLNGPAPGRFSGPAPDRGGREGD